MRLLGVVFVVVLTACGVSKPLTPPLELVQPPCGIRLPCSDSSIPKRRVSS